MYAHIMGTVDGIYQDRVVIDVGGVGYELLCSGATLKKLHIGENTKLITHFHMAQDVVALYGFMDMQERTMFRKLISVTRIGPKLALSVLNVLSVSDIAVAILTENVAAFDKISGMGRKTAARVLLELKEKISADEMVGAGLPEGAGKALDVRTEAIAALVSLGYDGASAGRAVAALPECERVEEMITLALRELAKKG
ncbi:MAG: Holliday junction branch migration protein RuvA [Clostridia bacterium]